MNQSPAHVPSAEGRLARHGVPGAGSTSTAGRLSAIAMRRWRAACSSELARLGLALSSGREALDCALQAMSGGLRSE